MLSLKASSHLEVISTNDDDGVAKLLSDRVLNRKRLHIFENRRIAFIDCKLFLCKLNHTKMWVYLLSYFYLL
jgi:hypothetical protein